MECEGRATDLIPAGWVEPPITVGVMLPVGWSTAWLVRPYMADQLPNQV